MGYYLQADATAQVLTIRQIDTETNTNRVLREFPMDCTTEVKASGSSISIVTDAPYQSANITMSFDWPFFQGYISGVDQGISSFTDMMNYFSTVVTAACNDQLGNAGNTGGSDADFLKGNPVAISVPSVGQVLTWDGTSWTPTTTTSTSTVTSQNGVQGDGSGASPLDVNYSADAGNTAVQGTDGGIFVPSGGATPAAAISPAANDGVGAVGGSVDYAREDHKHPAQGISADAEQLLSIGTDGLHMLDPDNLISADLNNIIVKGTDGLLYTFALSTITTDTTALGVTVTGNAVDVTLLSLDANNGLSTGTDGGLFFNPIEQSVVADIAARNALADITSGAMVFVVDASADATVDAGAALYVWDGAAWQKISEFESLDIMAATVISPASDDAIGLVGTADEYARGDHKHPAQGVSTDAEQLLTIGADGLHMLDPDNVISADADNILAKGADGLLYSSIETDSTLDGNGVTGSALSIADDSVSTVKVVDDAITLDKLAGGTSGKLIGFDINGDPAELDAVDGLRGAPVADNTALTALTAKDYERRKVLADGKEYIFEVGALSGAFADDATTGFWKLQTTPAYDTTFGENITTAVPALDWDLNNGNKWLIGAEDSGTLNFPSNVVEGQLIVVRFITVGTGSRTISFGSGFVDGTNAQLPDLVLEEGTTKYMTFHAESATTMVTLDYPAESKARYHILSSEVSPAVTLLPTLDEVQGVITANGITGVTAYYNGSDTPAGESLYVYDVDADGVTTLLREPKSLDLIAQISSLSSTNVLEPIMVSGGNGRTVRLRDEDSANGGYYQSNANVPDNAVSTVNFSVNLNAAATNTFAIESRDFPGIDTAFIAVNLADGTTSTGVTGAAGFPVIKNQTIKGDFADITVEFPILASASTWRVYPAFSDIATPLVADPTKVGEANVNKLDFLAQDVSSSPISAQRIDASAAAYSQTLSATTVTGDVLFFVNIDLTNGATLSVQPGETLNGVTDGTFTFSNYAAGTQFRADEVNGGWVVSVVGASQETGLAYGRMTLNGATGTSNDMGTVGSPTTAVYESADFSDDITANPATGEFTIIKSGKYRPKAFHSAENRNDDIYGMLFVDGLEVERILWQIPGTTATGALFEFAKRSFSVGQVVTFRLSGPTADDVADQNRDGIVEFFEIEQIPTTESVLAGMVTPQPLDRFMRSRSNFLTSALWDTVDTPLDATVLDVVDVAPSTDNIVDNNDGTVTLKAGSSYKLTADVLYFADATVDTADTFYQWHDGSAYVGSKGASVSRSDSGGGFSPAIHFTGLLGADTTFSVRNSDVDTTGNAFIAGTKIVVEMVPVSSVVMPDAVPVEDLHYFYASELADNISSIKQTSAAVQVNSAVIGTTIDLSTPDVSNNIGLTESANVLTIVQDGRYRADLSATVIRSDNGEYPVIQIVKNGTDILASQLSGTNAVGVGRGVLSCVFEGDLVIGDTISFHFGNSNGAVSVDLVSYNVLVSQQSAKTVTALNPLFTESKDLDIAYGTFLSGTTIFGYTANTPINLGDAGWNFTDANSLIDVANDKIVIKNSGNYHAWWALSGRNWNTEADDYVQVLVDGVVVGAAAVWEQDTSNTYNYMRVDWYGSLTAGQEITFQTTDTPAGNGTRPQFAVVQLPSTEYVTPGDVPVEDVEVVEGFLPGSTSIVNNSTLTLLDNGRTWSDLANDYERIRIELVLIDSGGADFHTSMVLNPQDFSGASSFRFFDGSGANDDFAFTIQLAGVGLSTATIIQYGSVDWSQGSIRVVGIKGQKTVINTVDTPVNDQATSGYMDIGDMRMQWGRANSSSAGIVTITYPAPFADANYSLTGSVADSSLSGRLVLFGSLTTTDASMSCVDSASGALNTQDVSWQAIGLKP